MTNINNIIDEIQSTNKTNFTKDEILTLIKSIGSETQNKIESNGVTINPTTMIVTFNKEEYHFPKKEFQLLYYLILNKNKFVSREQIIKDVWGSDVYVDNKIISVHIHRIRKTLPNHFIKTNKGVGYRWIEQI